jgi:hypothetical protein
MREGLEVGRQVLARTTDGSFSSPGVLADHKHIFGWRNPCYDGEGFYFVKLSHIDSIQIVHEDDLVLANKDA